MEKHGKKIKTPLIWQLAAVGVASLAGACSTTTPVTVDVEPKPEPEAPKSAPEVRDPYAGEWGMTTEMGGNAVAAVMTLAYNESGTLTGTWESRGQTMDLASISTDGRTIRFDREIPGGQVLSYLGQLDGENLNGSWTGSFGEMPCHGTRDSVNPFPDRHSRPIIEEDGASLLWANDTEDGDATYFDVTDAQIDPVTFQFGIGKDSIPSIDEPEFVFPSDPILAERGVTPETEVLGVILGGVARAYPVEIMDMHEVVNDDFDGESFAVLW